MAVAVVSAMTTLCGAAAGSGGGVVVHSISTAVRVFLLGSQPSMRFGKGCSFSIVGGLTRASTFVEVGGCHARFLP